eukprot:GDKI01019511.1.p1 GENE.GDKI01019511.1~~GDKI01019511.1.p1  ORF type:complete len:134 (-),score=16.58 GDKI01019511.1:42-389(-)
MDQLNAIWKEYEDKHACSRFLRSDAYKQLVPFCCDIGISPYSGVPRERAYVTCGEEDYTRGPAAWREFTEFLTGMTVIDPNAKGESDLAKGAKKAWTGFKGAMHTIGNAIMPESN